MQTFNVFFVRVKFKK